MVSCFRSKSKRSAKYSKRQKEDDVRERNYHREKLMRSKFESLNTTEQGEKEYDVTVHKSFQPSNKQSSTSVLEEKYFNPSPVVVANEQDSHLVQAAQVATKCRLKGFRSSMIWRDTSDDQMSNSSKVISFGSEGRQAYDSGVNSQTLMGNSTRSPEFCINLDVSNYDPGEVTVKYEEGALLVEGKHYSETEYGHEACSFYRRYPVPPGIEEQDISCRTRKDGVLVMHGKAVASTLRASNRQLGTRKEVMPHQIASHQPSLKIQHVGPAVRRIMGQIHHQTLETIPDVEVEETFDDFEIQGDRYVLCLNLHGFSPKDVYVNVSGSNLCVKGEQVSENADGTLDSRTKTKLQKFYTLPKDVDISSISSKMSRDGVMKIEIAKASSSGIL